MCVPNIHWLFLESSKRASQVLTNHYVSCSHHEKAASLTPSSSPVPAAVEVNTESVWMSLMGQCVICAHFQSHQPRRPEQCWVPKREREISPLSNSVLPFISQAQRLFYLNFGMSLIKNLASSQPLPRNDSSEKSSISSGLHPSKRRGLTLVQFRGQMGRFHVNFTSFPPSCWFLLFLSYGDCQNSQVCQWIQKDVDSSGSKGC